MSRTPFSLGFRLGPFPVTVEPTFFLFPLVAFRASWMTLAWAAVIFASVLVHELGHALAARRYGAGASIRLYALGGLTYHDALPKTRQRIIVSLAGPGAGFALGLVALAFDLLLPPDRSPVVGFTLRALLYANFTWGVVNLLPVPPLDGGHVLEDAVGPRHRFLPYQVGAIVAAAAAVEGYRRWGIVATLMFAYLSIRCIGTWFRLSAEHRFQHQLVRLRNTMWEDALSSNDVGVAHVGVFRETMRELRETTRAPAPRAPTPEPEADQERDPALLARVFDELGLPGRAAEHAVEAHRRDPSEASALQAVRLLVAAGRREEAESLVTRTRWSAEATRAEAAALLQSPSPTRSRG
ncbi:MAG TPA: site-2 protease family protein [Myxococcaceae bacterium]